MCTSKDLEEMPELKSRLKRTWIRIFHVICNLAAFGLTCWCFYKYMKDDDVSLVNYKRYHSDKDSIYPSLTLCFNNPFLNDKLESFGNGINTTTYSKFLNGLYWDERFIKIDYDNVTINLESYLEGAKIILGNGSVYNTTGKRMHYVVMRSSSMKCFSFEPPFLPDIGIEYLVVVLKNSIFPYGFRPTHHNFDPKREDFNGRGSGFEVRFNFPRQVFRSDFTAKWIWESLGNNASNKWVGMTFKVKDIEVLKRRSKSGLPCNSEWQHDDQKIMKEIIRIVQCKPPHWDVYTELDICPLVVFVAVQFSNIF